MKDSTLPPGEVEPGGLPQSPAPAPRVQDRQLSTVFEIARILAGEHNLPVMLTRFLHVLIDTFDVADAGMLLLLGEDGLLAPSAAVGYAPHTSQQLRLAPGESITGRAYDSGQPALYATSDEVTAAMRNLSPANRQVLTTTDAGPVEPSSAICIPLSSGSRRLGVLLLENLSQPGHFTENDLTFLQHVADLITLSIENAALRSRLQEVQAVSEGNRLKAEVISTLAHELRTPLTSIKGYSSALLMEDVSFSPETQREFLQIIDQECDTLQDLIHDLLESSVIDAGFLKLELEPVMLNRLARATVDDIMHRTDRHHFYVDFPADFPIVDADRQRIAQVLRNLLDNAIKYSPEGGLVVLRGEARESEVVISVADQGEGIAPEHLNRLFEKYFRIKSGLGRHVVGTGLGLPIARTIVENHGGRIWAESQLDRGTTFYFTLPRRDSTANGSTSEEQQHD